MRYYASIEYDDFNGETYEKIIFRTSYKGLVESVQQALQGRGYYGVSKHAYPRLFAAWTVDKNEKETTITNKMEGEINGLF